MALEWDMTTAVLHTKDILNIYARKAWHLNLDTFLPMSKEILCIVLTIRFYHAISLAILQQR